MELLPPESAFLRGLGKGHGLVVINKNGVGTQVNQTDYFSFIYLHNEECYYHLSNEQLYY
jgi:hypothetical protein